MGTDFRHKSLADPPPPEAGSPLANLAEKETDDRRYFSLIICDHLVSSNLCSSAKKDFFQQALTDFPPKKGFILLKSLF